MNEHPRIPAPSPAPDTSRLLDTPLAEADTNAAVDALRAALERYGLTTEAGPGRVTVQHAARSLTLRLESGQWFRPIAGTDREALVARVGAENHLATALARELRGRL